MSFVGSFRKIDRSFFAAVGFDFMQYFVLLLIVLGSVAMFYKLYVPLFDVQDTVNKISDQVAQSGELPQISDDLGAEMEGNISTVKWFVAEIIMLAVAVYLLFLLCSGLGRGIVYGLLENKRRSRKYLTRFLWYNTGWIMLWNILFVLTFVATKPGVSPYIFIIELILYFHFSTIFRHFIGERKGFKKTMSMFFSIGIKKAHRFIIPFLVVLLILFIVVQVTSFSGTIPFMVVFLALLFFMLFFMSWARLYYFQAIYKIK